MFRRLLVFMIFRLNGKELMNSHPVKREIALFAIFGGYFLKKLHKRLFYWPEKKFLSRFPSKN